MIKKKTKFSFEGGFLLVVLMLIIYGVVWIVMSIALWKILSIPYMVIRLLLALGTILFIMGGIALRD